MKHLLLIIMGVLAVISGSAKTAAATQAGGPRPQANADSVNAASRETIPAGKSAAANPDYPARETRNLAGWTVHISRDLLATNAADTGVALKLLAAQLEDIVRVVPPAAVAELRKVSLWVSPEYPGVKPRAEYHPNAAWLREHGRDPAMAKGVEFTNVRIFESETTRMPVFVLHELAHAYHDRVLGHQHAGIKAAYEAAKASGNYDKVERHDARGRVTIERAYAMTNCEEYFAETTEAFFGTNDFYPFTRAELKQTDPVGCVLIEELWGVSRDSAPAASNQTTPSKS